MEQIGFSSKWIRGCLNSAYALVFVNGSPTKEFGICKGLRQGDPLSPFLFIIAAEALHVTIKEAKAKRLFEEVKVGDNGVDLSHPQFADDELLLGKWSLDNARNLCRILRCFNMASGLKVNFSKSKFFSISVTPDEVSRFASILCFLSSSFPFVYLSLPIGANMNKACNWKPIIEKFKNGLPLGKLDLFRSSFNLYQKGQRWFYFHWNDHWVGETCLKSAYPRLYYLDINKEYRIRDRVGSSSHQHVYFWDWRRPIRDGPGRTQLNRLLNVLSNVALTASPDEWIFNSTDSTSFSKSEMRYIIDSSFLYSSIVGVRWNKNLPIKISIHSWRLSLNHLPTRFNLYRRGIDLNSVRCPMCDGDIETNLHVVVKCPIAVSVWNSISRW
ncbi:putative RNA-directed DNA polymerase, eukaryota, reverse transcriptase zinc-binding domain protein [Tanacetum coccineum]